MIAGKHYDFVYLARNLNGNSELSKVLSVPIAD